MSSLSLILLFYCYHCAWCEDIERERRTGKLGTDERETEEAISRILKRRYFAAKALYVLEKTKSSSRFGKKRTMMDFTSVSDKISTFTRNAKMEAERLFLPSASSLGLPVSSAEDVIMAESEFARLCAQSQAPEEAEKYKKELDEARFRLAWALSHSRREEHLRHAENILMDETLEWDDVLTHRDRYYLKAVLYYNRNDYLSCRDNAFTCLSVDPTCVQAQNLRQACEEYLARDGIIGITGVVAGVAVLGAMFASRR